MQFPEAFKSPTRPQRVARLLREGSLASIQCLMHLEGDATEMPSSFFRSCEVIEWIVRNPLSESAPACSFKFVLGGKATKIGVPSRSKSSSLGNILDQASSLPRAPAMNGFGVENPATPQETIPVKLGDSYKSRFGNENLSKNLDYLSTPQSSKPPRAPGMEQPDLDGNATEPSIREVVATAISWENPLLSGILTLAGIILAILGDYLIKGKHGIPLLSGIAYGFLLDLAINFFRSVLSSKWQENSTWLNSQTLSHLHRTAAQSINHLAAFHDKYLSAQDPFLTLKVAAALWSLTYLGYALSIWRLVCLAYFTAFALGAAKTYGYGHIKTQSESTVASIKERWNALGLRRAQGAAVLAVVLLVLVYYSSWMTRLLTVFLALIIIRCNLKPNEVDAIASKANTTCAPYMHSAKKQARKLGHAASDLVRRTSMGSTMKAHRK